MKKLFFLILLIPFLAMPQNNAEYAIMENTLLTPNSADVKKFETNIASHNKQFHAEGPFGARVYYIASGENAGSYMWVMGPLPWSAMDSREESEAHTNDWNSNVQPYISNKTATTYWKFENGLSSFPVDFTLDKLLLDFYDIKRFQGDKVNSAMEKVKKVMGDAYKDMAYGIYMNEMPSTKDGKDMVAVYFFDKYSFMSEDPKFVDSYNKLYGDGSFKDFLKEWGEITEGGSTELWIFQPKLSGLSGEIQAADRN